MKDFQEALSNGFHHVTQIDREYLISLREQGFRVDDEGYYSKAFGDSAKYELCVFPIGEEGEYAIFVSVNHIPITIPLLIWNQKKVI